MTRLLDILFTLAALPFHREMTPKQAGRWQADTMCRRGG